MKKTEASFNSYEVKIVLNWAKINTSVFSITSNSIFSFSLVSSTCIVQYVQQGNNVMLKATMTNRLIW